MKTSILSKSILVLAVMFLCNLAMSAASPREYMYDTKEENGKVISKVIFLNDNGLLNKEVKYEFSYNENGKVSEKKAYRWNKSKDEWVPYYLTTYSYDAETGEINTTYGMWDKKKKSFSLNVQNMVAPATSYNDIFIIPILEYFIDTTENGANNKRRESLLLAPFSFAPIIFVISRK